MGGAASPGFADTTAVGAGTTRCRKTVTPRKIEANRRNAKSSTGPRTERGKRNSRFNAVTLGLFAKHIVIPTCDGEKAEKDFRSLLDEMHREFRPVGVYEEWLVVKIAECMWRLRRATRCENGAIREVHSSVHYGHDEGSLTTDLACRLSRLSQAEQQLLASGTLTQKLYAEVARLVEEARQKRNRSELENKLVETNIDRQEFLKVISDRKRFLDCYYDSVCRSEEDKWDSRSDYEALPPGGDMERILRYEERMHRQFDWALQRLLECQGRRKTWSPAPGGGFLSPDENTQRSQ